MRADFVNFNFVNFSFCTFRTKLFPKIKQSSIFLKFGLDYNLIVQNSVVSRKLENCSTFVSFGVNYARGLQSC